MQKTIVATIKVARSPSLHFLCKKKKRENAKTQSKTKKKQKTTQCLTIEQQKVNKCKWFADTRKSVVSTGPKLRGGGAKKGGAPLNKNFQHAHPKSPFPCGCFKKATFFWNRKVGNTQNNILPPYNSILVAALCKQGSKSTFSTTCQSGKLQQMLTLPGKISTCPKQRGTVHFVVV